MPTAAPVLRPGLLVGEDTVAGIDEGVTVVLIVDVAEPVADEDADEDEDEDEDAEP